MDLVSFIKTAVYKILIILTILAMVFSTLGIQPASASSTVPPLLPVAQLNALNDSNGNFEKYINEEIYLDVSKTTDNKTRVAAVKFNNINTTKSIISANLILNVTNDNDNINDMPVSDLVIRVGSSNWNDGSFPNNLDIPSEKVSVLKDTSGEPINVSIDVKELLKNPSAIDTQQITFLLSSDAKNMVIVKSENPIAPELGPYLEITYGDVQNSAPTDITLSSTSVIESQPSGTKVGTLSAADPDAVSSFTYSLVGGSGSTDNSSFSIVGNELRTNSSFDYQAKNSYSVRIQVTDNGGLTFEKIFTISVTKLNERPTDIVLSSLTVAENQPVGTVVGTFSATDPNVGETFTYSLVAGTGATDNSSFTVDGNQLKTAGIFDYEAKNNYSVRIQVSDSANNLYEKAFTINISDVNEAPTDISLSPTSVEENQPSGTKVGTLSATDPDAGSSFTYSLVGGAGSTDNSGFSIAGDKLQTNSPFDYETKNSYSVRIRVTDQGDLSFEKVFTISVTDVNEVPIPTLVSTVPVNNMTNASINPTLTLNFSKSVSGIAGKHLRIYDQDNNLIETIEATATNVTVNGSNVSIQLTNNLIKATTYYVLMDDGTFVDTSNQGVAGITAKNIWSFTTLPPSNNAYLSNLVISPGSLSPNFTDSILDYQINVAHNVENIGIMPTTANSSATLTVNGSVIASGLLNTIPLNVGSNTITIVVTAENGVATKTYTLTVIRALPTLEQVDNVALSPSGIATWTDLTGESCYAVQLLKDGSPIGSIVDISADTTTHNFLPAMRAAGVGTYTVTVTAKGDGLVYLDGVPSSHSNTQTVIKLASITNGLSWDGNIAKWQTIPNALSYDVLLYKEGTAVGTAANVLAGNINEGVDFTTAFQTNSIGSYTFTVQPKGDELLILDGDQGVSSAAKIITPLTYTVLYNGNGSTGGTAPQDNATYSQNDNIIVAANGGYLVKIGHSFIGWNTKADGTGTSYLPNETFKMAKENVTLFAQWTINHYTVSFDVAGGSVVSNQVVAHRGKASQPTQVPTKAGYTFGGWYTSSAYTTPYTFDNVITANTVIYAKWISNNTGGGNTDPSPNLEPGSAIPSTKVEEIVIDVESGDGNLVSKTTIKRTKNVDNTMKDEVTLTAESATETIKKLKEQGNDTARVIIPDQKDQVNQVHVSIPNNVVTLLKTGAVHLEIVTDNVRIEVPKTSLEIFNDDLYFRLVPIKELDKQLEIKERAKREIVVQQLVESAVVELLGRPMTIETNMQNRPVILTLPLPTDLTDEQLAHLAIFIEHSDGSKEVVRGKVVEYQKGIAGLQFEVNKFSTFSILYVPEKEDVKEPTTDAVTHTPYIQGYPDGTFRPNAPVTRAQMASMFARQLTGNAIPQARATYTDTIQHDAKDAIEFAKDAGLFKGITETNFHPDGFITRAQMATVAVRWMERHCADSPNVEFCKSTSQGMIFKDVSVNHWAVKAINAVNGLGIMNGMTVDIFNPDGYLSRAEAVKVLNDLFERQVTTELQTPIFKDVLSNHWAFNEIQEAAKK